MTIFFMVVLITALFALNAIGQTAASSPTPAALVTPENPLPKWLPIATTNDVREWAVTNDMDHYVGFKLTFKNTNDSWRYFDYPILRTKIGSYSDYVDIVATNCFELLKRVKAYSALKPQSPVILNSNVEFWDDTIPPSLVFYTNLGLVETLTEDTFRNLDQSWYRVIIPIVGLEEFRISLNGIDEVVPQHTNLVIIDQKYLFGSRNWKFQIKANGFSAQYDKIGEQPAVRFEVNSEKVTAFIPAGMGATIQSSPDLQAWTTVRELDSTESDNFTSFYVNKYDPSMFYRAIQR